MKSILGLSSDKERFRESEAMPPEELRKAVDAEVKRVSDIFRFALKYKEHFQPSGVEFSGLRQYLPSDDASRIDWKISAGKPDLYVKEFDVERNMDVFIITDVSSTMTFGTAEKLKSEYAATVTSALAFASVDAGIDVGMGMYGSSSRVVTPGSGNSQYQRILHEITKYDRYGDSFNLEDALNDAIGQIKDNTAVFIISDFLDVRGDWKPKMTLANKKFRHVMSVMVRDLRDYKLPDAGNFRFESPQGGEETVINTSRSRKKFNEEAQKRENEMKDRLTGAGSSFLKIDTREEFAGKFAEFFDQDEGDW